MKTIDFDTQRTERTKLDALIAVNDLVMIARRDVLRALPVQLRKQFFIKLRARREEVFTRAGIALPLVTNVASRLIRHSFLRSLPIDDKVKMHMAMTEVVREIAQRMALGQIFELEEQRAIQLGGIKMCKTDADSATLKQITRDTVENVKSKYREIERVKNS